MENHWLGKFNKIGRGGGLEVIALTIISYLAKIFSPPGANFKTNVYLSELDQFVKRKLRAKYYVRYADDFVVLNGDKAYLENLLGEINKFLAEKLDLQLHPQKIIIEKYHQGVDFLGYVISPHHNILRTKTKNRIINKMLEKSENFEEGLISETHFSQSLQSYFGILKHCRGHGIKKKIKEIIFGKYKKNLKVFL